LLNANADVAVAVGAAGAVRVAVAVEVGVALGVAPVAVGVAVAVAVGIGVRSVIPLTESSTFSVLCPDSVNVRSPFTFFTGLVGSNLTSMRHDCRRAMNHRRCHPTLRKGDETSMLVKVMASVSDLLVAVTVCAALMRPTMTSPNLSFSGLSSSS
jgi:hypothetical protein